MGEKELVTSYVMTFGTLIDADIDYSSHHPGVIYTPPLRRAQYGLRVLSISLCMYG